MKSSIFFITAMALWVVPGCSQNPSVENKIDKTQIKVGGRCEGCEAIFECPMLFEKLNETDTLPDFNEPGQKIVIGGIIYKADGKTPASGVVLYIYHTDQKGLYTAGANATGWQKRHGAIRGWVKTNKAGFYEFYTLVPASYPNSNNPKHIHPTIKEPGFTEYWIDDFVFDEDSLLPQKERNKTDAAGGNGVLKTINKNGILAATRNIILGLHVQDYPK